MIEATAPAISTESLAVTFRPRTLDEVEGQPQAITMLKKMRAENQFPAAILLSGPTGTGKTTISRLIAKLIFCKNGTTCLECENCKKVEDKILTPYIEINCGEDTGIDRIRTLFKETRSHADPRFNSKWVINLDDECHLLSSQAKSALLKPIEEGATKSRNKIWILTTTNPEKLPATLRGRAVHIELGPIDLTVLAKYLQFIADNSQKPITEELANLIAEHSNGLVRNAIATLEGELFAGNLDAQGFVIPSEGLLESIDVADAKCGLLYNYYIGNVVGMLEALSVFDNISVQLANSLSYTNTCVIYALGQLVDKNLKFPPKYYADKYTKGLISHVRALTADGSTMDVLMRGGG